MKNKLILLSIIFCGTMAQAAVQNGTYEVPRKDGKVVQFLSTIEFKGDNLSKAKEFTVLFPTQLVGVENRFTIKKTAQGYSGDPELFELVDCGASAEYDFTCELHFHKDAVVDITEPMSQEMKAQNAINELIPLMAADGLIPAPKILVDRNLAKQNMIEAGTFTMAEISMRLESGISFVNEPIGFFNYRIQQNYP